jgi:hypothetical protein
LLGDELTALDLTVEQPVLLVKLALDIDTLETALAADQNFTAKVKLFLPLSDISKTQVIAEVNASAKYFATTVALHVKPKSHFCVTSGIFQNIKNFSCHY